jgi:hypothetical protein
MRGLSQELHDLKLSHARWESGRHRYLFIRTLGNKDDSGLFWLRQRKTIAGLWTLVALA